jgi:hypothetical protein
VREWVVATHSRSSSSVSEWRSEEMSIFLSEGATQWCGVVKEWRSEGVMQWCSGGVTASPKTAGTHSLTHSLARSLRVHVTALTLTLMSEGVKE